MHACYLHKIEEGLYNYTYTCGYILHIVDVLILLTKRLLGGGINMAGWDKLLQSGTLPKNILG